MQDETRKQDLINIDDIEVIIKIKGEGKLKATAILKQKNMSIKVFRIIDSEFENKSGDKIWVQPPSYHAGKYHTMLYLEPKEEWTKIEERVIQQFKMSYDYYYMKKLNVKDGEVEIDIENINFNNQKDTIVTI